MRTLATGIDSALKKSFSSSGGGGFFFACLFFFHQGAVTSRHIAMVGYPYAVSYGAVRF